MLTNSSILITGGTGSFGHAFIPMTLAKYNPKKLVVYSRDEMKQWEMAKLFQDDPRVRFFIGDVRDKDRLYRALDGIDYVVHAAATKIVPTAEYDPFECVKTNVIGAMNLIDACIDRRVKRIISISTDKASSPANLYGATKLVSDKLFVTANNFKGKSKTKFSVVRYGNVAASRGSVIPLFRKLISQSKKLTLTDPRMTRFWMTLEESVKFVDKCFKLMNGGEIFVPKLKSFRIVDLIQALDSSIKIKKIGIRPGEKLHEVMCPNEEYQNTLEFKDYFAIYQSINFFTEKNYYKISLKKKSSKKVSSDFEYNSKMNKYFLSVKDLKSELKKLINKKN